MRIDSSVVAMQSERSYYSAMQKQKADVTQTPVSVILSISGDAREQMENSINVNGQAVGQSGSQEKSTTPLDLLMENTLKSNQAAQTGTNETDAVVRKMGVYLKENGQAGTMSHVDLAL